MPQTSTHFAWPEGQAPKIRNCAALAPERPRTLVLEIAWESASGTPWQNGSFVRAKPGTPGYIASCTVNGTFTAARPSDALRARTSSKKLFVKHFAILQSPPPPVGGIFPLPALGDMGRGYASGERSLRCYSTSDGQTHSENRHISSTD